jgi:hypothetical protein
MEPHRFASSVVTQRGHKAGGHFCATYIFSHNLPASFPTLEKERGNRETYLKEQEGVVELMGVASLSLMFHGRVGLAHVGGHARAPVKSHKSGVYDNGGDSYLSCARGPCISSPSRRICRGMHGIL